MPYSHGLQVPLENYKNKHRAKGFGSDFPYLLIAVTLMIAVFLPMFRSQLIMLEKIKGVSDILKRFCGSEIMESDEKSIHLKLIKGKK